MQTFRKKHSNINHKKRNTRKTITRKRNNKKIKFSYFDFGGRAFPIRVALYKAFGKDKWIDYRIGDEFQKLKKEGVFPLGSVPIITFPNGKTYSQSTALARWAGKKSGLYPINAEKGLLVDYILETTNEIWSNSPKSSPDKLKKDREEYSKKGFMFKAMIQLNKHYTNKKGFCTDKLTIADLLVYSTIDTILTNQFTYIPPEYINNFPNLKNMYNKLKNHNLIISYFKNYSS